MQDAQRDPQREMFEEQLQLEREQLMHRKRGDDQRVIKKST